MAQVNYLISKANLMNLSLNALLDFKSSKIICISHDVEKGYIGVENCPDDLQKLLWNRLDEIKPNKDVPVNIDGISGGLCMGNPVKIADVIQIVSEWVNEQD